MAMAAKIRKTVRVKWNPPMENSGVVNSKRLFTSGGAQITSASRSQSIARTITSPMRPVTPSACRPGLPLFAGSPGSPAAARSRLPQKQHHVGRDHGQSERRTIHIEEGRHRQHRCDYKAEPRHEPEEGTGMIGPERHPSQPGHQSPGQQVVADHQDDPYSGGYGAVNTPDEAGQHHCERTDQHGAAQEGTHQVELDGRAARKIVLHLAAGQTAGSVRGRGFSGRQRAASRWGSWRPSTCDRTR